MNTFLPLKINSSDTCSCIIKENELAVNFKDYKQNCLLKRINNEYLNDLRENQNLSIIVYIIDYDTNHFYRSLYFSFEYRSQNSYALPENCENIHSDNTKKVYLEFLVLEYLNDKIKDKISQRTLMIINPLFNYNLKNCIYFDNDDHLFKRIIIIPFIGFTLF